MLMRQVEPAPRVDPRQQACRYPLLILLHHRGRPQSGFMFASKWRGCIQWPRPRSCGAVSYRRLYRDPSLYERAKFNCARSSRGVWRLSRSAKFWSGKVDGSGACV
jgi:hypothetical protein